MLAPPPRAARRQRPGRHRPPHLERILADLPALTPQLEAQGARGEALLEARPPCAPRRARHGRQQRVEPKLPAVSARGLRRVLFDVNVVPGVLFDRQPHVRTAGELEALVPAHGVTTIHHIACQARGAAVARRLVGDVLSALPVAAINQAVLLRAAALDWRDFEGAVCAAAAEAAGCDAIVRRNVGDFEQVPLPVLAPETALALLLEARRE